MGDGERFVDVPAMVRPRTCRELVAVAREFFRDQTVPSSEREDGWAVLTALRGPDDGDERAKEASTAVVRHAFLGESPKAFLDGPDGVGFFPALGCLSGPDSEAAAEYRRGLSPSHFAGHVRCAFRALGLRWDSANVGDSPPTVPYRDGQDP